MKKGPGQSVMISTAWIGATATSVRAESSGAVHSFGKYNSSVMGFRPDEIPKPFPCQVPSLSHLVVTAIACGEGHTIVLTDAGNVLSFGSNNKFLLGRASDQLEDSEARLVEIKEPVQQISAGLEHSVALTRSGKIFVWGNFQIGDWSYSLAPVMKTTMEKPLFPCERNRERSDDSDFEEEIESNEECSHKYLRVIKIQQRSLASGDVRIAKIASGSNHVLILTHSREVYSYGSNEYGQLGVTTRIKEIRKVADTSQEQNIFNDVPHRVSIKSAGSKKELKVRDMFCGENRSFFLPTYGTSVFVCGSNKYGELGIPDSEIIFNPTISPAFEPEEASTFQRDEEGGRRKGKEKGGRRKRKGWMEIVAGIKHVIALREDGFVFTLGNSELRLGGSVPKISLSPVHFPEKCIKVKAGVYTAYAITKSGNLFGWGRGEEYLLATGNEATFTVPTPCLAGENVEIGRFVIDVCSSTSHSVVLLGEKFKSEGVEVTDVGLTTGIDRKNYRPMNLVKEARECAVSLVFRDCNALQACIELVFEHVDHSNGRLTMTDDDIFSPSKSNLEQFFNKFLSFHYPNGQVFYGSRDSYLFFRYLHFVYKEVLWAVTNQLESVQFTNNSQTEVVDNFAEHIERLKENFTDKNNLIMNVKRMFNMNENACMRFNWLLKEASSRLKSLTQEEHKRIFKLYQDMSFDEKSESSDTKRDQYFEAAKQLLYKQEIYKIAMPHNSVINLEVIPGWATPPSTRNRRQRIQK
ncbi:unnamed protein product [Orchesella dallaii]|uniref:Uncharacterized protein n=1 Tax=Orchesella dallaii TaxID=48710 RepID=A0ABP1QF10_9HEXA